MEQFGISILGNVAERRTEAEIAWRRRETVERIAVVYDTHEGWVTQMEHPGLVHSAGPDFEAAVEKARERLKIYVNRLGEDYPDGLTAAGLSLWLLEKADGTTMGVQSVAKPANAPLPTPGTLSERQLSGKP